MDHPGLCPEDGDSTTSLGSVPVLCHPHTDKMFPDVQTEATVFQFVSTASGSVFQLGGHHHILVCGLFVPRCRTLYFIAPDSPLMSGPGFLKTVLLVKAKAKKAFSSSAFSKYFVTSISSCSTMGPHIL